MVGLINLSPYSYLLESKDSVIGLVNKHYPKFSRLYGIQKAKYIDEGGSGEAYTIPNNLIFKITEDKSEAMASSILMKNKLKFCWKVLFVGQFSSSIKHSYRDYKYAIIGEELSPLGSKDEKIFGDVKKYIFPYGNYSGYFEDSSTFDEYIDLHMEDNVYEKNIKEALQKHKKYCLWMYDALVELRENGITFRDNNPSNIMVNGNKWKFVDLGESISASNKINIIKG